MCTMKGVPYKTLLHKLLVISLVFLISGASFTPFVYGKSASSLKTETLQELYLLRGEHFLCLNATEDVGDFHIRYAFPPVYGYQVPILLEIMSDSTANILAYELKNDTHEPNILIDFLLGPMEKDASVSIHFYCWVLVNNNNFTDLPDYVKIPKRSELPEQTQPWLSSTDVVQAGNILIKIKAIQLKGFSSNLLVLSQRIAFYVKWHRYPFYCFQLAFGTLRGQDALTTLMRNGDCPGRSHLSCAFFRAIGVPARVILTTPQYPFWYQMHFMNEYFCPEYGWILSEVHNAETPMEPKNQIIMRICSLDDENTTGHDFFFSKMTGVERWFWIDDEAILPYYKDLNEGSKINMFQEKTVLTNTTSAHYANNVTKRVFFLYKQYLGKNLTNENLQHFQDGLEYQQLAILSLQQAQDLSDYISCIEKAISEYEQIMY
jgi:hypothetical protein